MKDKYDYIIIGSGFGGSVSAMRLAEKGYSVLVIEKGKEYKNEDFPKTNHSLKKFFWLPQLKWFGFQKLTFFRNAFILSGVGVGGGSLGYANTHLIPPDKFFENPVWRKFRDWKKILSPFYEKAKFMLGTTHYESLHLADLTLKEIAKDMGREKDFKNVDVGVYFGDTETETDPYFEGKGPLRKGCTECGGCMVGCRFNAKNTLDKNYLWFAQKYGAKIIAETKAEKIEFKDNSYIVHTHSSTSFFHKKKKTFKSKGIIFAGGVLGTLDLLLKQKYKYKTLLQLSEKLGENLRTNSESLCGFTAKNEKLNHGIAITSGFHADDNTSIEIVKYPEGSNVMKFFSTLATGKGSNLVRPLKWLGNIFIKPHYFFKHLFSNKWAENSVIFLIMQSIDNSMKMVYKKFPFPRVTIIKPKGSKVPSYIETGQNVMHRFAKKIDGIPQNALTEVLFNMSTTAHIIGGCSMGSDKNEGVINDKFEVYGYPKMYIFDGSIIQANLEVNPSLTITAISEYGVSLIKPKLSDYLLR